MDTQSETPPGGRPADIAAIEAALAAEDPADPAGEAAVSAPMSGAVSEARTFLATPTGDGPPTAPLEPSVARQSVPWWPFLIYLAVWIGSTVAAGWELSRASSGGILYGSAQYAYMVLAGLLLTLFGPAVTFLVWLVSWLSARRGERSGLLSTSLARGALVTFAGVALWWGMLVFVDATRLGRPW
jgi:hypothetical protein